MSKYVWTNDLIPKPIDPINGLILASGHYIIHLSFFFAIFFVKKAEDRIICQEENNFGEVVPVEIFMTLNQDLEFLLYMHFVCCIFQSLVQYLESYYPDFHLTVFMSILTIFVYQSLILGAQTSII